MGKPKMAANPEENSEMISSINVTPFVDVVLVLLVIFMVTAPLIAKDILNLRLPKTESGDGKSMSTLGVAINRQGLVLLNGTPISDEELTAQVKKAMAENAETQAIVSADEEVNYGRVVRAIDLIKSAGLNKFAIQVERK